MDHRIAPHISTNVETFISEHIRESYPDLIAFLSAYFEYLETEHGAGFFSNTLPEQRDISLVGDELLPALRSEFAKYFPGALINEERLLSIIVDLYKHKGTVKGIDLLFRIFFNEEVVVSFPKDNMLRVSDGKWDQHCFIDIETEEDITEFQNILQPKITSYFEETGFVLYDIPIDFLEVITPTKARLYFKVLYQNTFVKDAPFVLLTDEENGLSIKGNLIQVPVGVVIGLEGQNWQVGQVITIPGSYRDTIARVIEVGANGEIEKFEIIEFGYDHEPNQFVTVSPYKIKPVGINYDIHTEIVSTDPLALKYTLDIFDGNTSVNDLIIGTLNGLPVIEEATTTNGILILNRDKYFLYDYSLQQYDGGYELHYLPASKTEPISLPGLTIEDWFAARATIGVIHGLVGKTKGVFLTSDGIVSEPEAVIQDSYFYQLFSYVIKTELDIAQYREILKQTHPAGLKFFADLQKQLLSVVTDYIFAYTNKSIEVVYLHDIIDAISDFQDKLIIKQLEDQSESDDQISFVFEQGTISNSINIDDGTLTNITTEFSEEMYSIEEYGDDYYEVLYTTTLTIS